MIGEQVAPSFDEGREGEGEHMGGRWVGEGVNAVYTLIHQPTLLAAPFHVTCAHVCIMCSPICGPEQWRQERCGVPLA